MYMRIVWFSYRSSTVGTVGRSAPSQSTFVLAQAQVGRAQCSSEGLCAPGAEGSTRHPRA